MSSLTAEPPTVKKLLLVLLLLGAGLAGAAWFLMQRYSSLAGAAACTEVAVEYGPLAETVSVTAVVQPPRVYPVGTEAVGKVVEVAADFNQVVEEGAVLLRLDDRAARQKRDQAASAVDAARAALAQAEGARDAASAVLERERRLDPALRRVTETRLAEGHLKSAEAAVEAARVKIKQAQQELALAELALEQTVVRAPVLRPGDAGRTGVGALAGDSASGSSRHTFVVLDRKVSLNQMIGPPLNAQLFTLAGDQSVMHVEAQVPEGDAGKIPRGLEADITVATADADLHFRGTVKDIRLLPINDRGAIYYKVIIEAANQRDPATGRWQLTPGLTATVDLHRRKRAHAWKMPAMALSFQPEEALLSKEARDKLKRWQSVKDADWWKPVWIAGAGGKPWPVFVRVGGKGPSGETGLHDLSFTEVLEWDPELSPHPEAGKPATYPRVIIAAPPGKHGLFDPPNLKF